MLDKQELFMTQEEVRAAVAATKSRQLHVSPEDKIRINCSHRATNGKLAVIPKVIKVTDANGNLRDKKVLKCAICGEIIEQITEAEFRQYMVLLPEMTRKIINYVKAFDKKWTEDERAFCMMTQFSILNLVMLLEATVTDAKKKNNNNNQGPRKMVTSSSLFGQGGRY